jgi:hypothetical protein
MAQDNLKKIRLTVANKAAELIAEEGITDYHYAKTKAAKCLGFCAKEKLPSNNEIDEALIAYKNIYHRADFAIIQELKKITLKYMKLFEEFNPHAPSQLLEGYISKYPTIEINLYHDDIKAVEYILLNNHIHFETTDISLYGKGSKKKSNRNLPIYKIESDLMPIQIKVFEANDFKIGSKNLLKARGMDIKAVESFEPNLFPEDTQQPV